MGLNGFFFTTESLLHLHLFGFRFILPTWTMQMLFLWPNKQPNGLVEIAK